MDEMKNRLKNLLIENKMSNAELSRRVGISKNSIGYILKGTKPKSENLEKIAKVFNVSTDYLAGLSDVRTPDTTTAGISIATRIPEKEVDALRNLPDYSLVFIRCFLACNEESQAAFNNSLAGFIESNDPLTAQLNKLQVLSMLDKLLDSIKKIAKGESDDEEER